MMTIEEKAKAYDEAFEKAKMTIDLAADKDLVKGIVGTIFPVLKNDYNDKMLKEAVSIIQSYMNICDEEGDPCLSGTAVISWLENANKAMHAVELIDEYINMHTANAHDMKNNDPMKKYYMGVDDTLSDICGILQEAYKEK